MITISINGREGKITSRELVTSGSVGMSVSFTFSAEWNTLTKVATFKGGGKHIDMLLTQSGSDYTCQIPYDVLANANTHLMIGAYGTSGDGSIAIPTVWVDYGLIEPGAVPSGAAPTPTDMSLIDQLLHGDTLPVNKGGTGATTAAEARNTLGLGNTTGALPIANGGTNATTRPNAIENLAFLGTNPVTTTENDTPARWAALGSGYAYNSSAGQIVDQPNQWGIIVSTVVGNRVTQVWHTMPGGSLYRRGGGSNGWEGSWRMILDSTSEPLLASTLDNYRFIKPDAVVRPPYALQSVNSQGMTCDGTDVYITYRASADDAQTMSIAKVSLQSILNRSPVISRTGAIGPYHLNNLAYHDGKIYCFNGSNDTAKNYIVVVVDAATLTVIKTVNFATKVWGGAVIKPSQTIGETLIVQPEYSKNLDYYASYNDDNNHTLYPFATVNLSFTGTETFQAAWHANLDRLYSVCTAWNARTKASGNQVVRVYSYRGELMREWYLPSLIQSPGIELEDVWVDDDNETMLVNDASGNIYVFTLPELYSTMQTGIDRAYSLAGNLIHAYINPSPLDVNEAFDSFYGGTVSVQAAFPLTDLAFMNATMGDVRGFGFVSPYRFPIFCNSATDRIWVNGHIPFSNGDSTDFSLTYGRKLSASGNNYLFALMSVSITATDISAHSATVYSATANSESEWGVLTNHNSGMGKAISDAAAGGWLPGNIYINHIDYTVGTRRLYTFNGQDLLN